MNPQQKKNLKVVIPVFIVMLGITLKFTEWISGRTSLFQTSVILWSLLGVALIVQAFVNRSQNR
jgi:hypothetical protein